MNRKVRITILAILIVIAAGFAAFNLADPENVELSQEIRDQVHRMGGGDFVHLTDGFTHYQVGGPDSGDVVVLAAGSSVPYYIWDPTYDALTEVGFRVIRYDYFGRGYSDRPDIPLTQAVHVRQLNDLLDSLHVTKPIVLAGLSYGGTVITSYATAHADRVGSLIYVDPSIHRPVTIPTVATIPVIRDIGLLWNSRGWAPGQLDDFLHPENFPRWVDQYRTQMGFVGFRRGRMSDMQANAAFDQLPQLAEVGKNERPVLVIWGRQDRTVPFDRSKELLAAMPHARIVPVDSSGHLPMWEQSRVTHGAILAFLHGTLGAGAHTVANVRFDAAQSVKGDGSTCHRLAEYIVVEQEHTQSLGADMYVRPFTARNCGADSLAGDWVYRSEDPNYFAGMIGDRLILDSGTGPDIRELIVLDVTNRKALVRTHYVDSEAGPSREVIGVWRGYELKEPGECPASVGGLIAGIDSLVNLNLRTGELAFAGKVRCAQRQ